MINYATERGDDIPVIKRLRMADLIMDRYQRPYDLSHGRRISKAFKSELCEPLVVNRRACGTLACVDGQHRAKALILRFGRDVTWPCRVLVGLSFEDEARLFMQLNEQRKPMSISARFHSALLAHDAEAVAIAEIVQSHGLRVGTETTGKNANDNVIQAVGSLLRVHRSYGAEMLDDVLGLYVNAYGTRPAPGAGEIRGLATLLSRYRGMVDQHRLVKIMRETTLARWRAESSDMQRVLGASVEVASGMVLARNYNRRLRESYRLPDWTVAGQATHAIRTSAQEAE